MRIKISNIKMDFRHTQEQLLKVISDACRTQITEYKIIKKSIDSRKKPNIFFNYSVEVDSKRLNKNILKSRDIIEYETKKYKISKIKNIKNRPVIVGFGPCGLFAALVLAKAGLKPIIIERGEEASKRYESVKKYIKENELNVNSNIQFGEGGAGTFSDGKLNTGVKDKFARKEFILNIFVEAGADPSIVYLNKPHIGTDYLVEIVENIRENIISLGGEVYFNTKFEGFKYENEKVVGINTKNVKTKEEMFIEAKDVVLAIGHSSRDTFRYLYNQKIEMQSKDFAIGVRIEHTQELINYSQYGKEHYQSECLPSADYKLTAHTDSQRGVYTFCMCPGGEVVNASSEEGRYTCNGMSKFARSSKNANSAIIVTVKQEDFVKYTNDNTPLCGIKFQEHFEELAYKSTNGEGLPVQKYGDFYKTVTNKEANEVKMPACLTQKGKYEIDSSVKYGVKEADLTTCLPEEISEALVVGIEAFGRKIKGFNHPNSLLTGIEARTSSPVRIVRDKEMKASIDGVYPAGEGAGYAGGIMSAAIDGIKIAEKICEKYM